MNIMAIWERPAANERYGGIFLLAKDGHLIYCAQETEFDGTDKHGNRIYKETGFPDFGNAFEEEDRFDFDKAELYLKHFGGQLIWRKDK